VYWLFLCFSFGHGDGDGVKPGRLGPEQLDEASCVARSKGLNLESGDSRDGVAIHANFAYW